MTRISGNANDPSHNTDMISSAFWLVSEIEFKITRSDGPQHTALLKTTNLCLAGLRRLNPKSQTTVTSETVRFCPEINVWDDVVSIIGASTKQPKALNKLLATEKCKTPIRLAFGVTAGVLEMDQ